MAPLARGLVAVNSPHHVTQRGNGKQFILNGDAERLVYLDLLQENVKLTASWPWSSAAEHDTTRQGPPWLDMEAWSKRWFPQNWREYLACGERPEELAAIRQCMHTGRPLGTAQFLESLAEATCQRRCKNPHSSG